MDAALATQWDRDVAVVDRHVRHAGRPVTMVWLALTVATLASWWLGGGHGSTGVAAVLVIATGFLKVALIGEHFMELRGAPPELRYAFMGWSILMPTIICGIYLVRR